MSLSRSLNKSASTISQAGGFETRGRRKGRRKKSLATSGPSFIHYRCTLRRYHDEKHKC